MIVHIPEDQEGNEQVSENPVATVDEFIVGDGPEGFPSVPSQEESDNGPKQGVSGPTVGSA